MSVHKCIHVSVGRHMLYNSVVLRSEDKYKSWCSSSTLLETALLSLSFASANFSLFGQRAFGDFPNSTSHLIIGADRFQMCVNMYVFYMTLGVLNLRFCMQVVLP